MVRLFIYFHLFFFFFTCIFVITAFDIKQCNISVTIYMPCYYYFFLHIHHNLNFKKIKYEFEFKKIGDIFFFQRKTKQNSRLSLIVKLSFPYNTRVDLEVSQWDTCTILGYVVSKIRVFNHGIFTIKYNIYPIKLKWHRYFAKMSWNVKCNIIPKLFFFVIKKALSVISTKCTLNFHEIFNNDSLKYVRKMTNDDYQQINETHCKIRN